jgi:hypothetical protein
MADIYSKIEAYNAVGGNDTGATVGANSRKTAHDTFNYGTPAIYPLVVTRTDEGDWTGHADAGSDFHKVMAVIQTRAEIYGIGEISGTVFTLLVNLNTLAQDDNDYDDVPGDDADLDYLATEISNATSIGVEIENGKIVGENIANDC